MYSRSDTEHRLNVARSKAGYLRALCERGSHGSHYYEQINWRVRDLSDHLNAWGQAVRQEAHTSVEHRYTGESGCL